MGRRMRMTIVSVLAGAAAGAIVLSALTWVFHWVFFRRAQSDGQYALVLFVTVAVGTVLGAMTGLIVMYLSLGQTGPAELVGVSGGEFLTVLFIVMGWFLFGGTEKPTIRQRLTATLFWFGIPLLWTSLLIRFGLT